MLSPPKMRYLKAPVGGSQYHSPEEGEGKHIVKLSVKGASVAVIPLSKGKDRQG